MEQDESSDSDIEEVLGFEQPTLIEGLKNILSEYPDDGQILKELVQNAEDAGASEIKILFDGRHINKEKDRRVPYRKFFKCPALCFFNNGMFSEEDWRGIRMLNKSIKKNQPLKVGRFGLGFKSVFHITDNPCIISGKKILLMNPLVKRASQEIIVMGLENLKKNKKLKIEDVFGAIQGVFGFSESNLQTGNYNGTLFWFPLREERSELSDNIYDKIKVTDLFRSFESEAVDSLLFLKSLCQVQLYCRNSGTEWDLPDSQPFFTTELQDDHGKVKEERSNFLKQIQTSHGSIPSSNIVSVTYLKFKTTYKTSSAAKTTDTEWLVVNMYKGGDSSDKLRQLTEDAELGYNPFVGVAFQLKHANLEFKGHIFCFLPLPQEKKSLTGLPIHINGFFALSQNRRYLKWASADQDTLHTHRDKAIEWNECLVCEVLPEIYLCLLQELIEKSNREGNRQESVEAVYKCFPDCSMIDSKWEAVAKGLFQRVFQVECVFLRNVQRWAKPLDPTYTMFDGQQVEFQTKECVRKTLDMYAHEITATVPSNVWDFMKASTGPNDISPTKFSSILCNGNAYQKTSKEDKLFLLKYLVAGDNFSLLQNLQLIPLEDDSFSVFQKRVKNQSMETVFVCSEEEVRLFPGLKNRFVSTRIPSQVTVAIKEIAKLGDYQIQILTDTDVVRLVKLTIQQNFGIREPVHLTFTTQESRFASWIKDIWVYLQHKPNFCSAFRNMPLLPVIVNGEWRNESWKHGELHLYQMSHLFLLQSSVGMDEIPENVCKALEHLSVKILPSLPPWIDAKSLDCIYYPTKLDISRLFEALLDSGACDIDHFNTHIQQEEREDLVEFLAGCCSHFEARNITLLKQLNLFEEKFSVNKTAVIYTSLERNNNLANVSDDFPIDLPEPYLVARPTATYFALATTLGAQVFDETTIVEHVIQAICRSSSEHKSMYSNTEISKFMKWFCQNFSCYSHNKEIVDKAKNIAFVQCGENDKLCKPSELFDPREKDLKWLFNGEAKFPTEEFSTCLDVMKALGLKQLTDVTAEDIFDIATALDDSCEHNVESEMILQKAEALFRFIETNVDIVLRDIGDSRRKLSTVIGNLRCIPHETARPSEYPVFLPWKGSKTILSSPYEIKSKSFANCAGAVLPLKSFTCGELGRIFRWNETPNIPVLISQLENIVHAYDSKRKPKLLLLVSNIYELMANTFKDREAEDYTLLFRKECVWWGNGFCHPRQIVIERSHDDVDLQPYVYYLPEEFTPFQVFFRNIGCYQRQDIDVYLTVQNMAMNRHNTDANIDEYEVGKDLKTIIQILERLYHEGRGDDRILFPIHCNSDERLILKPLSQCTYCDAQWLQDMVEDNDENIHYVHNEVPQEVAEGLGVKSLRQHMMSETEPLEEWGQEEPLTRRLNRILEEGYVDGLSVPKELIQNADDAGATEICFIYDERENLDCRTQLLDERMAELQGQALLVYNNAFFSDDDLKNITKLNGGTKECDAAKIGKFGLGFCAVYNLTDVPSFISGHDFVIFDPHKTYLGKALPGSSPGLRINLKSLKNMKMMKRLNNQFKPFYGVLGCELSTGNPFFNGTLFRFPLRTPKQAATSEIKNCHYTGSEIVELLTHLIWSLGNMLLFTQMLQRIKVFHIPVSCKDPSEAVLICTVEKNLYQKMCHEKSVLQICSDLKADKLLEDKPFRWLQRFSIKHEIKETVDFKIKESNYESHWLVSWATSTSESLRLCYASSLKGNLPLGSIAVLLSDCNSALNIRYLEDAPLGFYRDGHIFCYLPLPIQTALPIHINGSFAVTSDRRGLRTSTEDDRYAYDSNWNHCILNDAIVQAFIHLLESLHNSKELQQNISTEYRFYKLWPLDAIPLISNFKTSFYQTVVQCNNPVFQSGDRWFGMKNCLFLEKKLVYDKEIGSTALSTLKKFNANEEYCVVELPSHFFEEIERVPGWNQLCHVLTVKNFFANFFLPNVSNIYWSTEESIQHRDKMLLYCIAQNDSDLNELLKCCDCIPTLPHGNLRKPGDLVHPKSILSPLFLPEDERFPEEFFEEYKTLCGLLRLGMMQSVLHNAVVQERAISISKLASEERQDEAMSRCQHLVKYLSTCQEIPDVIQELRDIAYLPVLAKPATWPLHWHGVATMQDVSSQSIMFEKPVNLFLESCKELVACNSLILHEQDWNGISSSLFSKLGVKTKDDIPLEAVVNQLKTICQYPEEILGDRADKIERIVERIYMYLDRKCRDQPDVLKDKMTVLLEEPIIFLQKRFLPISKVVFSMTHNCTPELFEIGQSRINKHRTFLELVGVKMNFDVKTVVQVIQTKRLQFENKKLPEKEFQLICNLLYYLTHLMLESGITYDDLISYGEENIVGPDSDKILRPTYQLCFDDCDFVGTTKSMKFVHGNLSRTCSEKMGVYTKRRKCIEDCSQEIPFEQKESLVTRLRGLLDGYPCDVGIMKELIQNADDAHASEVHFMLDFRTHSCRRIFEESFEKFQGPALCVFNDSSFSKADLDGIQNLGAGSKSTDPCKTGQYGVGFNAVYNLTDMPSFLTKGPDIDRGETLCIFDPLQKHCKRSVGTRYIDMNTLRITFSDVMSGYNESDLFCGRNYGTVFRLPLRTSISDISNNVITPENMEKIFSDFQAEMFDIMLFLKSVGKIAVSCITNEKKEILYSVETSLCDKAKELRAQFNDKRREIGSSLKTGALSILDVKSFQVQYEVLTKDNVGRNANWFVVQKIGFSTKNFSETLKIAASERMIGLLPQGGIAVQMPEMQNNKVLSRMKSRADAQEFDGRAYCFLPLPGRTGLPMHVNGHFVLDHEARRSLWKEDEGFKSEWNMSLLSDVVAPAYIKALIFIRSKLFPEDGIDKQSLSVVNTKIQIFEDFFPDFSRINDKYWKYLVKYICQTVVEKQIKCFPVILRGLGHGTLEIQCVWHAFHEDGHKFSIVFGEGKSDILEILKKLGMKISSASSKVQRTMEAVGITCKDLTPNVVISFLKSYNCNEPDKVKLPSLPCSLQETVIQNVTIAVKILKFCGKSDNFQKELPSLPLLVTNDSLLRCFDSARKVYCSEICDLFQKSANDFIHIKLVQSIQRQNMKMMFGDMVKSLCLFDLADLLQSEIQCLYNTDEGFIKWSQHNNAVPNEAWIKRLWKFVTEIFQQSNDDIKFFQFLEPLLDWCLLPAYNNKMGYILMKVRKMTELVYLSTFEGVPELKGALNAMEIPRFNEKYLSAMMPVTSCLVSQKTPLLLLKCLYNFQGRFNSDPLSRSSCYAILRYFSDNLKKMQKEESSQQLIVYLKALKVFPIKNGNPVCLVRDSCTFVVFPDEIPSDGLDEWCQMSDRVVLEESKEFKILYEFLGIKYTDECSIYLKHILKTWDALPGYALPAHLTYIKDIVLGKQPHDEMQLQLIKLLCGLEIIPGNNTRKKASDYFSPHHPVFAAMCREEDFPPDMFRQDIWKEFMELMGMIKTVNGQKFIEFAKDVASEGKHKMTFSSKQKSQVLVKHLLAESKFQTNELKDISLIKFVVPHTVSKRYNGIHKQICDVEKFICFSKSISCRYEELTWTSQPLLPKWADPLNHTQNADRTEDDLGIYHRPPLDKIILHCQNVCDSLANIFKDKSKSEQNKEWIQCYMEKLYESLQSEGMLDETSRQRLYHTPVVFVSDISLFVPAYQVVEELTSYQEIKPYLLKAPRYYGKYFKLFKYLGANEQPSYVNYIRVLKLIREKVGESKLTSENLPEWGIIRQAVDNLFRVLKEQSNTDLEEGTVLYLPTRGRRMIDATLMFVCDMFGLERRLGEERLGDLNIFVGFKNLEINNDHLHCIQRLPESLRPKQLSSVIKDSVDEKSMNILTSSPLARKLENFLLSPYFSEGLLRLLKHSMSERQVVFTESDQNKIIAKLQNITVKHVTGLNSYLFYNNERLAESGKKLTCYIPEPEIRNDTQYRCIYFQKDENQSEEKWLGSMDHRLVEFLKEITAYKIRKKAYIIKMIHKLNDPSSISDMLDEMEIDHFELSANACFSVFPDLGTYVPTELHHLLSCEFTSFEEHEYRCVALELEDDEVLDSENNLDSYSPVYIFVQILRKLSTEQENVSHINQLYLVFTGSDSVSVPAFKLYKLISQENNNESRDMVDTGAVPMSDSENAAYYTVLHTLRVAWNRPKDECRHIIKRLYLRWHPDKNIGNEDFCSKVFQYIKQVIYKLEKNLPLDDEDVQGGDSSCFGYNQQQQTASSGASCFWYNQKQRAYPDFTSSAYFSFCERLNRRCQRQKAYAASYYSNGDGRSSKNRCRMQYHTWFGYSCAKQTFSDKGEARRWIIQAKVDLRHAKETIDVKGYSTAYNWICYLCHQAAEKSLKAAWFFKNANQVAKKSHDLCALAVGLTQGLQELAQKLTYLVGEHTKMRYPDVLQRPKIPSTVYSQVQAEKACKITHDIVDQVVEEYSLE